MLVVALLALPVALGAAKTGLLPGAASDIVLRQVDPGNSLRPLRSFAPWLSAALLLLVLTRVGSATQRSALYGAILPSVEEYWGLWSAARRQHSERVDMTIHALGDERARQARLIGALPPLVTSSRPWATWGGQGWAMSVNWWFYAPLLQHYRIDATSPKTYLWARAEQPSWSPVACRVTPDANGLFIDGRAGDLFDVRAAYRVEAAPRRLLMAYNGLGMARGWVPLDDAAGQARFPVLFDKRVAASGVRFDTFPRQPGSPRIDVTGCTAAAIPMTNDIRAVLPGVPGP